MKFNLFYLSQFILFCLLSPLAVAQQTTPPVTALPDQAAPDMLSFMRNLANCDQLTDKAIIYKTSNTAFIRIYANPATFCVFENIDTAKPVGSQKQVCNFSKEQISSMVSPAAFQTVEAFDKNQSNLAEVRALFKPLSDCADRPSTNAQTPSGAAPTTTPQNYDYGKMIH